MKKTLCKLLKLHELKKKEHRPLTKATGAELWFELCSLHQGAESLSEDPSPLGLSEKGL
jgi:hypothetical protein